MPELDTEKWQPVGVFWGSETKRRGHSASWGVRAPGSSPQTYPCILFRLFLSDTFPRGLDSCGFKKEKKMKAVAQVLKSQGIRGQEMVLSGPSESWSWNLVGKEGALDILCFLFLSLSSSLPFLIV